MYSLGDTIYFSVSGADSTPLVQLKRVSDGLYLDFNDNTFKSSAWVSKYITLSLSGGVYRASWDSSVAVSVKTILDVEYYIGGDLAGVDQVFIGYGGGATLAQIFGESLSGYEVAGSFGKVVKDIKVVVDDLHTDVVDLHTDVGTAITNIGTVNGKVDTIDTVVDSVKTKVDLNLDKKISEITVDLSGLATRDDVNSVKYGMIKDIFDMVNTLSSVKDKYRIESFSSAYSLYGSGITCGSIVDNGKLCNSIGIDIVNVNGAYIAKILSDGNEFDLSDYTHLNVKYKSSVNGTFLRIGLGSDAHDEFTYNIPMSAMNDIDVASIDITSFSNRNRLKYIKFSVLAGIDSVDVDEISGEQLWHNWGVTSVLVNLYELDAYKFTPSLSDINTNINSIDLSGLATISNINEVKSIITNTEYLSRVVFEYVASRVVIDYMNDAWLSSDTAYLTCDMDAGRYYWGGQSMNVIVAADAPSGTKVSKTFENGKEIDLSRCTSVGMHVFSFAKGAFLKLRLSEDNSTWFEVVMTVVNDYEWERVSVSVSGMTSRSAIKYVEIEYIPGVAVIDTVEGTNLWPQWDFANVSIWFDKIEGVINPLTPLPGNWAT